MAAPLSRFPRSVGALRRSLPWGGGVRHGSRLAALRAADPEDDVRKFLKAAPELPDRRPLAPGEIPRPLEAVREAAREGTLPDRHVLEDLFGRRHNYLRISLTERCNLRCTYCMPAEGVELQPEDHLLSSEEIVKLARTLVGFGVDKIRLTGGEPLVRRDIVELCGELSALPGLKTLAITTNGIVLKRRLKALKAAGVSMFNVSLDTLDAAKYQSVTRRPGFDKVVEAIHDTIREGYAPLKVNCVLMKGFNDDELLDFVEWTRDLPVDVRFIEYMPFDANAWRDSKFLSFANMLDMITAKYPNLERLPGTSHDTSKGFRVPGYAGTLGFITSMSQNFCGGCNRLRVTADGNIKVCLFDNAEVSLRDVMRAGASDAELGAVVGQALGLKKAALGGNGDMHGIAASENRPMILIGG